MTLPCIICGRKLKSAFPEDGQLEVENQPYGGTAFTTHGHYGSTVFDPMVTNEVLEISICDQCLLQKGKEHKVLLNHPITKKEDNYEFWEYKFISKEEAEELEQRRVDFLEKSKGVFNKLFTHITANEWFK